MNNLNKKFMRAVTWIEKYSIFILIIFLSFRQSLNLEPIVYADSWGYLKCDGSRPWFIQFLFNIILQNNLKAIVIFQKIVFVFSAIFLIQALNQLFQNKKTKLIIQVVIGIYFLWWNIFGWTNVVLSESLTFSVTFFSIGLISSYFNSNNPIWLIFLAISIIIGSGIRDNLSLCFAAISILLIVLSILKKKHLLISIPLFGLSLFILIQNNLSIEKHKRHTTVLINSFQKRILPNNEFKNYFIKRGMPFNENYSVMYGLDSWDKDGYIYKNSNFKPFIEWVKKNGMGEYTQFLITHPIYTLTSPLTDRIIFQAIYGPTAYPGIPKSKFNMLPFLIYPFFNFKIVIALLAFIIYKSKTLNSISYLILLILSFTLAYFYTSYHGDAAEIPRHLIMYSPLIQLSGIIAICYLLDTFFFSKRVVEK